MSPPQGKSSPETICTMLAASEREKQFMMSSIHTINVFYNCQPGTNGENVTGDANSGLIDSAPDTSVATIV